MTLHSPKPAQLTVWRLLLIGITLLPAFLNSMIFEMGTAAWTLITLAWILLFLFFYLVYLPMRWRRLRYGLKEDQLILHTGVFYKTVKAVPIGHVQYVTTMANPLDRLFKICSVVVTAPGGRLAIPGLSPEEGEGLARLISREWAEPPSS